MRTQRLKSALTYLVIEGFLLYGVLSTVCETQWPVMETVGRYWLLGVYAILAVKVVLEKNRWADWLMIIGLLGLSELSRITTQTNAFLWFAAGILLAKNIDLNKVLKADLITRILLGGCLIALPLIGLYPNQSDLMIGGRLRSSFGWAHPNEMGLFFLMLCILWFYIRYEKWNWKDTLAMVVCIGFVDYFANSRTSEVAAVLLLGFAVLHMLLERKAQESILRIKGVSALAASVLLGGCGCLLGLMTISTPGTAWLNYFPETVSSRLLLANRFWAAQGFTLFGQVFDNTAYNYLDIMYAYLGLNYGVIILLLFIGLNLFAIWQAYTDKNEKFLIILLIFITYSLLEHEHFKMLSGFYPVLLGYYVWPWLDSCRVWVEQRWNRRKEK